MLLPACKWLKYETYTTETKELNLPLAPSGQTLEDYLSSCIAVEGELTTGMDLTCVEGVLAPAGDTYFLSEMKFTFYRYIDDSREGGYVRSAEYQVSAAGAQDAVLNSVYVFDGAGKAFTRGDCPMENTQIQYSAGELTQLFWQAAQLPQDDYNGAIRFVFWQSANGAAQRWYVEREDTGGWISVDAL